MKTFQGKEERGTCSFLRTVGAVSGIIGLFLFAFSSNMGPAVGVQEETAAASVPVGPISLTHAVVRGASGGWEISEVAHLDGGADDESAAAVGAFSDARQHRSFFGELHIRTAPSPRYSDDERAEASGVLEGYFTHERILQTAQNLACEVACDGSVPPEIEGFLSTQDLWIEGMVQAAKAARASRTAAEDSAEGYTDTHVIDACMHVCLTSFMRV